VPKFLWQIPLVSATHLFKLELQPNQAPLVLHPHLAVNHQTKEGCEGQESARHSHLSAPPTLKLSSKLLDKKHAEISQNKERTVSTVFQGERERLGQQERLKGIIAILLLYITTGQSLCLTSYRVVLYLCPYRQDSTCAHLNL
jgi:hypothetical protein